MGATSLQIYDIMACNVLVDFDFAPNREQHKFLVSFFPMENVFIPDLIEEMMGYGPGGYQVKFSQEKYSLHNRNGYILDRVFNSCWYMVNLDTGFLKEGEYGIKVTCKNGEVLTKARVQKKAPSEALVSAYRKNHDNMDQSHSPSKWKGMAKGAPLKDVKIAWSTLKELAKQDGFYIHRLCEATSAIEFDVQKLHWWDNIFVERFSKPDAGLNRSSVIVGKELKPKTSYAYFNEITDSNAMGETNICIFQPHQVFSTP